MRNLFFLFPAFTDFVDLRDWKHGNEGPGVWTESMAREHMIVGGPALRLDTTIFSNMRPHRAGPPPPGVPVVKLFAVVRLMGGEHDPNDDLARFGSVDCEAGPPMRTNLPTNGASCNSSSPKKSRTTGGSTIDTDGAGSTGGQGETATLTKEPDAAQEAGEMFGLPVDEAAPTNWPWKLTYTLGQENDERERIERMGSIPAFDADIQMLADNYGSMHDSGKEYLAELAIREAAEKAEDLRTGWVSPTLDENEVVSVTSEEDTSSPCDLTASPDPFAMSQASESALGSMILPSAPPQGHNVQSVLPAAPAIQRKTLRKQNSLAGPSSLVGATAGKGSTPLNPRLLEVSLASSESSSVSPSL